MIVIKHNRDLPSLLTPLCTCLVFITKLIINQLVILVELTLF